MKTCQNCGKTFKVRQIIDGKERILSARKYCLKCSPFGRHNTRQIHKHYKDKNGKRICVHCGKSKKISEFYIVNQKRAFACNKCRGAKEKNKGRTAKKFYVDYKGGKCEKCGYNKCVGALEFHHINPDTKEFKISDARYKPVEEVLKEIDKCQLLCSNCHKELHWNL